MIFTIPDFEEDKQEQSLPCVLPTLYDFDEICDVKYVKKSLVKNGRMDVCLEKNGKKYPFTDPMNHIYSEINISKKGGEELLHGINCFAPFENGLFYVKNLRLFRMDKGGITDIGDAEGVFDMIYHKKQGILELCRFVSLFERLSDEHRSLSGGILKGRYNVYEVNTEREFIKINP